VAAPLVVAVRNPFGNLFDTQMEPPTGGVRGRAALVGCRGGVAPDADVKSELSGLRHNFSITGDLMTDLLSMHFSKLKMERTGNDFPNFLATPL
jgi:hypothetical protein